MDLMLAALVVVGDASNTSLSIHYWTNLFTYLCTGGADCFIGVKLQYSTPTGQQRSWQRHRSSACK